MSKPRYRLSSTEPLAVGTRVLLGGNAAHYLAHVLRIKLGDTISLFTRADGEFSARIEHVGKRDVTVVPETHTRPPDRGTGLTVCFVPIKGGRLETIIEKATELGADILQPVFSARSVVDKINHDRAETIAREAAEQCERVSWPEIREPVKLLPLLGGWPQDMPLIYGDERGNGTPIGEMAIGSHHMPKPPRWSILAGPEGGFTADEFAALAKVPSANAVSLGPRILRADTAIITLAAATLIAWGDWNQTPRAMISTGKERP